MSNMKNVASGKLLRISIFLRQEHIITVLLYHYVIYNGKQIFVYIFKFLYSTRESNRDLKVNGAVLSSGICATLSKCFLVS